ncbi:MAG: hypothetical protein GC131_07100 [Alphaproteobacteria bacterium]|nr:hypothetical protein [Alphaproteobacteria bacterium]
MAEDTVPSANVRDAAPFNGSSALLGKVSCATKASTGCLGLSSTMAVTEANECVQWNYNISGSMSDFKRAGPHEKCVIPNKASKVESVGNYRWPVCCYSEQANKSCGLTCFLFVSR